MPIISKQVEYWKSLSKKELCIVILVMTGALTKTLLWLF